MNPIQAAAEEIKRSAGTYDDVFDSFVAETAEIITRHLWPVVKPSDVGGEGSYWIRTKGEWSICDAMHIHRHHDQIDEIRGPIPMPEEKQ